MFAFLVICLFSNNMYIFPAEEDVYGVYSNLLFKNFLAEGVVCGHNLFIASDKEEPGIILKVKKSFFHMNVS